MTSKVKKYWVSSNAAKRLEDIYAYTVETHGQAKADTYLDGIFALFEEIADGRIPWRPIAPQYEVKGYFARYKRHLVFWKQRGDGSIAVVSILHQRMDTGQRLREDHENE